MPKFIGRRVSVGLGMESTRGTAVAPTDWVRQLNLTLQRKSTKVKNDSALGRVEKTNESAVVEQWAEGQLSGKVSDVTIGYLLYQIFGTLVTTDNADSNAAVRDHTFDVQNSNSGPTMTVVRRDPVSNRRHALASLDDIEISFVSGDWVKFTANIKAKPGATNTDTAAYTAENEFTSKHVVVKLASAVAGLGAASAIPVKSGKIKLTRPSTMYFATGSIEPNDITTGAWEASGELVLQYEDGTYDDFAFANTTRALSIAFINTDVTIGAAANPSLTFTAPQATLETFEMSDDLDEIIEQTIGFNCELNTTAGYLLRAVLVNTKASY